MAIHITESNDVVIIAPEDKLMGAESVELRENLQGLIDKGFRKVVIDCGRLKWANSSGIGTIISCYLSLRRLDGDLRLARPAGRVSFYLHIAKLDSIFAIYETIEEAVASFEEPSGDIQSDR